MINRWKNGRLTLKEWQFIRVLAWLSINAWYWWKSAPLTEVFLINGLVWIVYLTTKIHSVALGMMMGVREEPQNPWEDITYIPPKKNEMN
jgi:hypothetical protein